MTLNAIFDGVKVSFYQSQYPTVEALLRAHGLPFSIATVTDIGLMKILAICGRCTRKDFYDLYTIDREVVSTEKLFELLPQKYGRLETSMYNILRSLAYFADAESEPDPKLNRPWKWEDVKAFFDIKQRVLYRKYAGEI